MVKPLTVYLDSSDYSNLSAKNDNQHKSCLQQLKDFSSRKQVEFVFSAFVVSEMVTTNPATIDVAKSRIKLMNELCSYSIAGFKELAELELNNIHKPRPLHLLRRKEQWIPESIVPLKKFKITASLGVNKKQFNDLACQHSKDNNYPLFISKITLGIQHGFLDQQEARVLLLSEMRNIDFLLEVIDFNFDLSLVLSGLVRESSSNFNRSIVDIIDHNQDLNISSLEWVSKAKKFLFNFIKNSSSKNRLNSDFNFSIEDIMYACPGLSTGILSSRFSVRDSFAVKQRRKIKESDFVDSMHSVYAPYVDIFRADRYMSQHIRQAGASNIIDNLFDLPDEIKRRLATV